MFATLIFDLRRYWYCRSRYLSWLIQAILMSGLIHIIYGEQYTDGVWIIVPVLSYLSLSLYQGVLSPRMVRLVRNGVQSEALFIRQQFLLIGVLFNGSMSMILSIIFGVSAPVFLAIWSVLDMLGAILYCLHILAGESRCTVVQLLLFPLSFPWLLFGVLLQHGEWYYFKPLMFMWSIFHAYGVLFYLYCIRISLVE